MVVERKSGDLLSANKQDYKPFNNYPACTTPIITYEHHDLYICFVKTVIPICLRNFCRAEAGVINRFISCFFDTYYHSSSTSEDKRMASRFVVKLFDLNRIDQGLDFMARGALVRVTACVCIVTSEPQPCMAIWFIWGRCFSDVKKISAVDFGGLVMSNKIVAVVLHQQGFLERVTAWIGLSSEPLIMERFQIQAGQ